MQRTYWPKFRELDRITYFGAVLDRLGCYLGVFKLFLLTSQTLAILKRKIPSYNKPLRK